MIEHCRRDIRYEHLQKIDTKSIFVLASGETDYAIAREGALKIKEITYLHAEGFMSSDLKHGPFAMLDESISVILIDTDAEKRERAVTCYREIKSRKTPILVFTTDKDHIFGEDAIVFDNSHVIIVFQYIAYTLSVMKNINPDEPRNLAKVVTVD
jgi:glucosamine--fructose-6-phosphate aminotransferase (isomerizing)